MDKRELEVLEEGYYESARSYGIQKHEARAIARKIVFGESASELIELAFSEKGIEGTKFEESYYENFARIKQFIYLEAMTRCCEEDWKGFANY